MPVELSQESREKIAHLLERYPTRRAVMLPALHIAMQELPLLDDEVCQIIADLLFYNMFPTEPRGKYFIQLCVNLPCSLNGARHLLRHMEQKLGISNGQMTPDGKFTLQGLECLAACDKAPMMYINEEQYNHLTPKQIDEILDALP